MNLILTPLCLKSMYSFFMGSTPIENDGDKESPRTSALLRTLDIACVSLLMAFPIPYSTSVLSIVDVILSTKLIDSFSDSLFFIVFVQYPYMCYMLHPLLF